MKQLSPITSQNHLNLVAVLSELTQIQVSMQSLANQIVREPDEESDVLIKAMALQRLSNLTGYLLDVCRETAGSETWQDVKENWILPHEYRREFKTKSNDEEVSDGE